MGLNELGANEVHSYVGQEPSGRMFNELTLDFNSNEKTTEKFKILEFFALSTISKIYFGEFKYSFYS